LVTFCPGLIFRHRPDNVKPDLLEPASGTEQARANRAGLFEFST